MYLKIEGDLLFLKLKIELCGAAHAGNVLSAFHEKTEVLRMDAFATSLNPRLEHFQSNRELLFIKNKVDSSNALY